MWFFHTLFYFLRAELKVVFPQYTFYFYSVFCVYSAGLFFCVQAWAVSGVCRLLYVCPSEDIAQPVSPACQSTRGVCVPAHLDRGQGAGESRACDELPQQRQVCSWRCLFFQGVSVSSISPQPLCESLHSAWLSNALLSFPSTHQLFFPLTPP